MTGRALRTTISSMTCIDNPAITSQTRHNPTGRPPWFPLPCLRSRAGLQTHVTIPWRPSAAFGGITPTHPRRERSRLPVHRKPPRFLRTKSLNHVPNRLDA